MARSSRFSEPNGVPYVQVDFPMLSRQADRPSKLRCVRKNQRNRGSRKLTLETLEHRQVMASLPFGAMPQDTGEFLIGKVSVTPVFLESNGQLDPNKENWTPATIQSTLTKVQEGVNWWVDLLAAQQSVHTLEFTFDTSYALTPVGTKYEPITRVSNDHVLWVQEFLTGSGFNSGNLELDMRAFNHAQRLKTGSNWAFTIFVVNSTSDADDKFAVGGQFAQAFSFAGGLFVVSPSGRPASTFAHETGHMFWAKDEYLGGSSFGERRGYYNTQNLNSADNPGSVQQPSIMAGGSLLDAAYAQRISAASTLAMVGWQDTDRDGIFDVLDVPLELDGVGSFDSGSSTYNFSGSAKVGVLPNLNSEGLRNDVTLNRISKIQYRINNGSWTLIAEPDDYETQLNLNIPLPPNSQTIEIRAVDSATNITSNVFLGRVSRADSVLAPGVNGFVWLDTNKNGLRDLGEFGNPGWTIELLSLSGQSLNLRKVIEPDNLPDGVLLAGSIAGISISAVGSDADGRAGVFTDSVTSTGTKTFRAFSRSSQSWSSTWNNATRRMQVDFGSPTSVVEIDAIGATNDAYGRLEAFDSNGKLIDRFTTSKLSNGQIAKMRVESFDGAISSVIVGGHANSVIRLDNLRYGPETVVTTQTRGQYRLPNLPSGSYLVKATPPSNAFGPLVSGGNQLSATVARGGTTTDIDFAYRSSSSIWQNAADRFDVNNDASVSALDVLLIVNDINQNQARDLASASFQAPPYVDVNGDGFSSALDALLVINFINSRGSGEGESPMFSGLPGSTDNDLALDAALNELFVGPNSKRRGSSWKEI